MTDQVSTMYTRRIGVIKANLKKGEQTRSQIKEEVKTEALAGVARLLEGTLCPDNALSDIRHALKKGVTLEELGLTRELWFVFKSFEESQRTVLRLMLEKVRSGEIVYANFEKALRTLEGYYVEFEINAEEIYWIRVRETIKARRALIALAAEVTETEVPLLPHDPCVEDVIMEIGLKDCAELGITMDEWENALKQAKLVLAKCAFQTAETHATNGCPELVAHDMAELKKWTDGLEYTGPYLKFADLIDPGQKSRLMRTAHIKRAERMFWKLTNYSEEIQPECILSSIKQLEVSLKSGRITVSQIDTTSDDADIKRIKRNALMYAGLELSKAGATGDFAAMRAIKAILKKLETL